MFSVLRKPLRAGCLRGDLPQRFSVQAGMIKPDEEGEAAELPCAEALFQGKD
jgi:hypothetical protein